MISQANRLSDNSYLATPLREIFSRMKCGFTTTDALQLCSMWPITTRFQELEFE